MRRLLAMVLLVWMGGASAGNDSELQRLTTLLNTLNHEQQALVQQLQILQEMRRSNTQALCGGQIMPPGVVDYADWVAAQRSAARREDDFREQTDQLYARWKELEADKRPVLQRIYELATPKKEYTCPRCHIPDDHIDKKRFPLFLAREALRELIEQLRQEAEGRKPS